MSSSNTGHWLYPILHFLTGMDHTQFDIWHPYIRKSGHVLGYGTLSVLLFLAWRTTLRLPSRCTWAWRWAVVSLSMTALVASLDEWHQLYLPGRTGAFHDVVLDSVAALAAQVLIALILTRRRFPPAHIVGAET